MENPRIYVASLSDYNNGRLEGKWFDFDDYSDASELMGAITEMLDEITKKYNDGEEREEWAVHDYEYIPSTLATEYMGERDFQTIYDIIEASEEYGIPTEVLMERVGDTGSEDYQSLAEGLMFVVDGNNESDIVYEMEEQLGELGFDFWQNHIYIDDVTQRVMYSEDVDRYREDIQSDNPDMDEDEVERLAEEQADDEENRRNDDLIGYLEEMGYADIPTWVSKDYESAWKNALSYDYDIISYDGKMYVFSINYSQGGNVMYNNGGNVQRLSDEDVARIQQAIEQSRHKGIIEKYQENSPFSQQNQISPKEAMQFVKENPEVLKLLVLKKGGKVNSENYDMLRGKLKEVKHHASELQSITNRKKEVPAWVLAKSTRASTDLSDITHYMDSAKFDKGGNISYKEQQINEVSSWDNDEIANYLGISISQVAKDRNRYVREAQSVLMLSSYGNGGNISSDQRRKGYVHGYKFDNPNDRETFTNYLEREDIDYYTRNGVVATKMAISNKELRKIGISQEFSEFSNGGGISRFNEGDRVTNRKGKNRGVGYIVTIHGNVSALVDFEEEGKSEWVSLSDLKKLRKFGNGGGVEDVSWDVIIHDDYDTETFELNVRGDFENEEDAIKQAIRENDIYVDESNYGQMYYRGNKITIYGAKRNYKNGGGITDYDWANEFRKGKPNKMVVVYRIDGNLMISEVEVEARNETEAYYNTRKQFEAQNPNAKIEKVYTLGDVEAGKFVEGGGINDELPYPYQMQWEKLLNDFGKDKVMRMFPSGANGYYTSRTKGNYSDDAIRQSLKSMYNEGDNVDGLSDLIKG